MKNYKKTRQKIFINDANFMFNKKILRNNAIPNYKKIKFNLKQNIPK